MAIINYTDQIKYAGKGYLDAKMMPVKTVDDLKAISLTQRFEGLTITVLNDGNPQDYWLVGGITNDKWIPKNPSNNYEELRLVLEDGFLKLMNGENQMGDAVDFNNFFPSNPGDTPSSEDLYIASVEYTTSNDKGEEGIYMCFTYSDGTKKYLNMSQFLANTYEQGNGIVIEGNVISIDSAIIGRIESLENNLINAFDAINVEKERAISAETQLNARITTIESDYAKSSDISELNSKISANTDAINAEKERAEEVENTLSERISNIENDYLKTEDKIELENKITEESEIREAADIKHTSDIDDLKSRINSLTTNVNTNTADIATLKERVNALSSAAAGSTPDGETIGIKDDETKSLYVKILNKEGNILTKETNDLGETGLYANIPVFFEDEELL